MWWTSTTPGQFYFLYQRNTKKLKSVVKVQKTRDAPFVSRTSAARVSTRQPMSSQVSGSGHHSVSTRVAEEQKKKKEKHLVRHGSWCDLFRQPSLLHLHRTGIRTESFLRISSDSEASAFFTSFKVDLQTQVMWSVFSQNDTFILNVSLNKCPPCGKRK